MNIVFNLTLRQLAFLVWREKCISYLKLSFKSILCKTPGFVKKKLQIFFWIFTWLFLYKTNRKVIKYSNIFCKPYSTKIRKLRKKNIPFINLNISVKNALFQYPKFSEIQHLYRNDILWNAFESTITNELKIFFSINWSYALSLYTRVS